MSAVSKRSVSAVAHARLVAEPVIGAERLETHAVSAALPGAAPLRPLVPYVRLECKGQTTRIAGVPEY
jgi:hypothetical protein